MNVYIIVEGARTEYIVYPEWLRMLAPELRRVNNVADIRDNNYYLFSGGGIPSIYDHVANAAEDIAAINATGDVRIDYLIVCIDTEEESRDYILQQINAVLDRRNVSIKDFQLKIFEQKVSMETWFLANRRIFKSNPEDAGLRRYIAHHNVREQDPELMDNISTDDFSTKAQFHHDYLKRIFREQHIVYSKSHPDEVCQRHYLNRIIERWQDTGHVASFGRWYTFVTDNFTNL